MSKTRGRTTVSGRMSTPSIELTCKNDHRFLLSPTALDDRIRDEKIACTKCKADLAFWRPFDLECHVCDNVYAVVTLKEACMLSDEGCNPCSDRGFGHIPFCVPDSWRYWWLIYRWTRDGRSKEDISRKMRNDYWEAVAHFCNAKEFISIFDDRRIIASSTGYFGADAVCLTEAPASDWAEIAEHQGGFGYVFRKRDVKKIGGQPVIHMLDDYIDAQKKIGFAEEIKPFVQLIRLAKNTKGRRKCDFLHEREWRTPIDIDLDVVKPFAVVIPQWRPKVKGWERIIEAAQEFEELSQ